MSDSSPLIVLRHVDPRHGSTGWLVIDRYVRGLAAGGLRVRPGVSAAELEELARNMVLKQAAVGIRVGGAKAGLDLDPGHPARAEILESFLTTLRPLLNESLSLGPDMNTTLPELEAIGRRVEVPALKIAVARSRGIPDDVFLRRYALFEEIVDDLGTVNSLRGATAAVAACHVLVEILGVTDRGRVAIQGAGNVGGAAARLLASAGVPVVAWADDEKCLVDERGLDVAALLEGRSGGRLPASGTHRPSSEVLAAPCDILVLAAVSRAFGADHIPRLRARAIVEIANMALAEEVEGRLHQAGILVVPDLIAGVGGSLAVESLYTGEPRTGGDVLRHVHQRASAETRTLLEESKTRDLPPRAVALARAANFLGQEA